MANNEIETKENESINRIDKRIAALTSDFQNFVKDEFDIENKNDGGAIEKQLKGKLLITKPEDNSYHTGNVGKSTFDRDENQNLTKFQENENVGKNKKIINSCEHSANEREETPDFIPLTVRENFNVLRIEEDTDKNILMEKNQSKETFSTQSSRNITPPSRVREVTPMPKLDTESTEYFRMNEKETPIVFHDNIELCMLRRNPPVPPQRRRSVKDIIESINRSQKLLKLNQTITPKFESKFQCDTRPILPPKGNVLIKLEQQLENEKRLNALLEDLQNFKTKDCCHDTKNQ